MGPAPDRAGEFYRRELPTLRAVLDGIGELGLLVVRRPGPGRPTWLGAHAHAELGIPVIGVAKSAFATATHAITVLRGLRPPGVRHCRRIPGGGAPALVRHMGGIAGSL